MIYYNQYNYAGVPYPCASIPNATVKSGGCGVCCGSMILGNLTSYKLDPAAMAAYSMQNGARVDGGTDLNILAAALCRDYPLLCRTTNDEIELVKHLKAGGLAVANVGGDRSGYVGVFSNGGHFVVVSGINSNGFLEVLDPAYYTGKFNKTGRIGKVLMQGDVAVCSVDVMAADTSSRSPQYWLFSRKEVQTVAELDWKEKIMQRGVDEGLLDPNTHKADEPSPKWFTVAVVLDAMDQIRKEMKQGGNV